ncbi:hypothetical protein [Actinacidiphila sp. ITFR-21]|uniref:hypothetical protein n=1 Tax=Actinacidiphila sp. ITFR-21 TaxID=3075199 RepID=UPI00288A64B6|nr:hypothetical protein [Streptomyces sp. ITFR-21]WNI16794.1 hypothetical protein RLT57_15570 [Streptomyces sp. ITFR-21]
MVEPFPVAGRLTELRTPVGRFGQTGWMKLLLEITGAERPDVELDGLHRTLRSDAAVPQTMTRAAYRPL